LTNERIKTKMNFAGEGAKPEDGKMNVLMVTKYSAISTMSGTCRDDDYLLEKYVRLLAMYGLEMGKMTYSIDKGFTKKHPL